MDTMDFSVPEQFRAFVQSRVDEGGFGSTNDYIAQLVEEDRKRKTREWLEAEIAKGIDSGPPEPMTAEDWESIRNEVRGRIESRIKKAM
jgi:antitoxin ParD1/3/4